MPKRRPNPAVEAQARNEETAAREVGRQLRETRLARGEDLETSSAYLRIRPAYLEALEAGELGRIPGRPYAIGFLRAYATHLGLDAEQLVASLKPSIDRVAAPPELHYREPIAEARRGTAVMVTASLLLAAAVYTGYYVIYHVDRGGAPTVTEAPGEVARLASDTLRRSDAERAGARAPAPASGQPSRGAGSGAGQPGRAASVPALSASDEIPAPDSAPTAANAASASATELLAALDGDRAAARRAAAPAASAGDPDGRVTLVALQSSLVQIRSSSKDYVRTQQLEPGQRFTIPNRNDLALWTGNAGGLEIMVDGRSQGPLGRPGEVVKAMPLAPDQLRARLAR